MNKEQAEKEIAAHLDAIQEIVKALDLNNAHLSIAVFTNMAFFYALDDKDVYHLDAYKSRDGQWVFY